ncbi:hypothetical protein E2C01_044817 [Portunus trituberculatus]|uniref:Uncharacterized protein n=1 Tax=Portunus trituberculatus TaxID=210409 RepID=A0A5B7FWK7_PORTR|nr:hypothetical protein [Portunus trituberculatus]
MLTMLQHRSRMEELQINGKKKKCVNCKGDHHALANKYPLRKKVIAEKSNIIIPEDPPSNAILNIMTKNTPANTTICNTTAPSEPSTSTNNIPFQTSTKAFENTLPSTTPSLRTCPYWKRFLAHIKGCKS